MKKKAIIVILSLLIILASAISSCDILSSTPTDTTGPSASDAESAERIAELEAQIIALMQSQQLSDEERKKEIASLEAKIEALRSSATDAPAPTDTEAAQSFKYTLENGKAVITHISAREDTLTIPSVIDGYQVYSIGSQALTSTTVKTVIISSGIEKLDWFAFSGCIALSSITIPTSIGSIGYGAFDNTSSSLVIHCTRDSFAHKYAQSYGLTYDIT